MALDYASIMQAGQGLVPDLQEQTYRRELNQSLIDQRRAQTQLRTDQAERERQFRADVAAATASGDPRAIHGLMIKYPEFADKIKPGWEAMDKQQKQRTLTQMGSIYVRAQNGDYAGAAKLLDARIAADKAAGLDTADDEQIRDALLSGNPDQQKIAVGTIGFTISAADPDKFGDTYGKLNPTDAKTAVQKEYEWRVRQFGQAAGDAWLAKQDVELIAVNQGGSVYNKADFADLPPLPGLISGYGGGTFNLDGSVATPVDRGAPSPQPRGGDPIRQGGVTSGGLTFPVANGKFGDGMGAPRDGGTRRHNGQDIQAPLGTPVNPVAPGEVVKVSSDAKSGTFVVVRHADGSTSSYSHLGSVAVQKGQPVSPGQPLGTVGQSGNATGSVLHLVLRDKDGNKIDPRNALRRTGSAGRSKVEESKNINGKTYFRIGGKWFDNPRGE